MNELQETGKNELMTMDENCLGAGDEITAHDLQISRLGIMQPSSSYVKEDKARQGAIIDIETEEELGYKSEKPLEFVVVKSQKYWVEFKDEEFLQRIPALHQNEKPWVEGDITRNFTHSFYILLTKDIRDGLVVPYELSFRSTDLKSARKISKILFLMAQQKVPSWNKIFSLTTELKTKGKFSWFSSRVELGTDSDQQTRLAAYNMYQQMKEAKITHTETVNTDQDSGEECQY